MPKKNDNIVGESQGPAFHGGRQTSQQAEIVKQEGGGKSDRERRTTWSESGRKGRTAPAVGGSSGGHSDQLAASGPDEDRKVAGGLYETERTRGKGASEAKPRQRPT